MAGRRSKGDGSIKKRADGRWEARLELERGPDGKRNRKYFFGATRQEVKDQLTQAQRLVETQSLMEGPDQTMSAYLNGWVEQSKLHVKTRTYYYYEQYCRLYLIPHLGKHKLSKLTAQHLEKMYRELSKTLSTRTVHHAHVVAKTALNHALRTGAVGRNVAVLLKAPRASRYQAKVWTQEEAQAFLKQAKASRLYPFFLLALTTGLRQAELFGLRWSDVDLERGAIRVDITIQRRKGPWYYEEPKSATSRRNVEIPEIMVQALKEQQERLKVEKLLSKDWVELGLVCPSRRGSPLTQTTLLRVYKVLVSNAQVPYIRFHDLRHSHASLLLALGQHPKVVQERLGHSSINVTLDLYSHMVPNLQKRAAEQIQGLFEEKEEE